MEFLKDKNCYLNITFDSERYKNNQLPFILFQLEFEGESYESLESIPDGNIETAYTLLNIINASLTDILSQRFAFKQEVKKEIDELTKGESK